ncbi:MAG: hypothetical protein WBV82_06295 [Myxococcaceae bacterium]
MHANLSLLTRCSSSQLSWAAVFLLLIGCSAPPSEPSVPVEKPSIGAFAATWVEAQLETSAARGFADQSGGGLFVDPLGKVVRFRIDGSQGPLEPHPSAGEAPGAVSAIWPVGPHEAVAVASNGLYLAKSGWVTPPPWASSLAPDGVLSLSEPKNDVAWVAHASGLFRVEQGALAELRVDGVSVTGLTAVAVAAAEDGQDGIWFARGARLTVAVPTAKGDTSIREGRLPAEALQGVKALVGLTRSAHAPAQLWVLDDGIYRLDTAGWKRVDLGAHPAQMMGAGRFVWVVLEGALVRFDADSGAWERAEFDAGELDPAATPTLLATEASGAAWVKIGARTLCIAKGSGPRLVGLDEGMKVSDDPLVVRAAFAPDLMPESVRYAVDGRTVVTAKPPEFSLGGLDANGSPTPYSFAGLEAGLHTLTAATKTADGAEAIRNVTFEYVPLEGGVASWEKDIRPIHESRCAHCHTRGPGRDLSGYTQWKAQASLILSAVRDEPRRMPADGSLDSESILRIQRWVTSGARP